jgi:hypothetical protein
MRLASATISSERLFSRLEGLSAIARVESEAKIAALQPFPTRLTSMRCPLYSMAVIAHRGSLHVNGSARMPPHLKYQYMESFRPPKRKSLPRLPVSALPGTSHSSEFRRRRCPARPQGQAGHPQHASDRRRRAARAPAAPARSGTEVALRVYIRARHPIHHRWLRQMIDRAATRAKLAIKAHPHMLRHACGYALANRGHDTRALQAYLGHKNIQHTVRYTELSPTRFKNFWRE